MRPKRLYLTDIADAANAIGRFFLAPRCLVWVMGNMEHTTSRV